MILQILTSGRVVVTDAFMDKEIQSHINQTLLRLIRDPEFKAELSKEAGALMQRQEIFDGATYLLSRVFLEDEIQKSLSELGRGILNDLMTDEMIARQTAKFINTIADIKMNPVRYDKTAAGKADFLGEEWEDYNQQMHKRYKRRLYRDLRDNTVEMQDVQDHVRKEHRPEEGFLNRVRGYNFDPLFGTFGKYNEQGFDNSAGIYRDDLTKQLHGGQIIHINLGLFFNQIIYYLPEFA